MKKRSKPQDARADAAVGTRGETVTVRLRDMILRGELRPGQRVPEAEISAALGVSRTPVRVALGVLRGEGLLEGEANRGFWVRAFTTAHVLSSFDVRGVLEGLACRLLTERGIDRKTERSLARCIDVGAELVAASELTDVGMRRWALANELFHRSIIEAADLPSLSDVYQYLTRMPLASPVAILFRGDRRARAIELVRQSHSEHEQIYHAVLQGESTRAEALVKEHAYRSKKNVQLELSAPADGESAAGDDIGEDWLQRLFDKLET